MSADAGRLADWISSSLRESGVKRRVLAVMERLDSDHWLRGNIEDYRSAVTNEDTWFDSLVFLNWYAHQFLPASYLEVGVRRGRSTAQVVVESPKTQVVGFDMWIPDYGSIPEQGIFTSNPGPEFVRAELQGLGARQTPEFIVGSSHDALPVFFANPENTQQFELMTIDGDHSFEGAKEDLDTAFEHLAPGGALVFDDICHPAHLYLLDLWHSYRSALSDHLFIEDDSGVGTGVAIKPPFTKYEALMREGDASPGRKALP